MSRFLSVDNLAQVYDRIGALQDTQAFYEDAALDELLQHGAFERARSIYEAGCGTGRVAHRLLREWLPADCRYVGADISSRMVALARTRTAPWPKASIVRADVTAFRPETRIDRVLSLFVVDLMPDAAIQAFLRCAYDALQRDGLLCIAGLAEGRSGPARFISEVWKRVHDVIPAAVGGCRPGSVASHLDTRHWQILHVQRRCSYGVSSEAVVATKA